MLGIWHGGEWLKRDLARPFYGQVERGSPISSWFISFINEKSFPLIFMCKSTDVFMDLMVECLLYLCFSYAGYMHIL